MSAQAARQATQLRMSEDDLLASVLECAKRHGWLIYHQRPNRLGQIVQGHKGFPDLVLARTVNFTGTDFTFTSEKVTLHHPTQRLFVELKSDRGRVSPGQQAWLDALYPYSVVWRPQQWRDGTIERALR